jgi:long-subunit acyl-CoA synthetase (AMP-forming)
MNSLFLQKNTSFLLKKASKIMNEKTLIEYFYRFEKEKAKLAVNEILPRYTKVSTVVIAKEPFTIENGLLTPTLKVKRFNVHQKYASQLKAYCEHKDKVIWA